MTKLVIIDFWAEWCGPCKALSPVLEKVAAAYADKGVMLAKIETDKNQFIASQFQIRSIPTVYAMFGGQLVADLTSARTESQLRVMLDQLLKQLPIPSDAAAEIEPLIAMGEDVLAEGDAERALSIFDQLAEMAPENPAVLSGHIRALVAAGQLDEAQARSMRYPPTSRMPASTVPVRHSTLPGRRSPCPTTPRWRRRWSTIPTIMNAVSRLRARRWQPGIATVRPTTSSSSSPRIAMERWRCARTAAQLFEVVGLMDPWVSAQRRRLSAILFG